MRGRWQGPLAVGLALAALIAAPAHAAPPLLSQDSSPADVASTYGSGNLGRWDVDAFGLPVYHYLVDQLTDPRAKQSELLNGGTKAQHQLGNDHIVAAAWNRGDTMLWSQDRLPQWANAYEPERQHYAGGYGFLNVDGKVFSTNFEDKSPGATITRDFGVGYYARHVTAAGIEANETVYAPFGDDPLLLHDVTIANTGDAAKKVSWFEYWDVNPYVRSDAHNRGVDAPVWDADGRTLTVGQAPDSGDTTPLSIFASALQGPVDGYETVIDNFFGVGGAKGAPAEVAADKLSNTIAPPTPAGLANRTLFVVRAPLTLAPGERVTLRYAYGIAHGEQIPGLVTKYRDADAPLAASERAWQGWLPRADFGASNTWVARELAWDAYLLRSASVYEEECGNHTITQGGYYQYAMGYNLGYRSWLHYMLPIAYTAPGLAREILRYSIQFQPQVSNEVPYGSGPLCTRFDLGTSNDLDFWLLLAAGEYGLGTRDTKFFDEPMTFHDTKQKASAWEHIKLAYANQESKKGPHGGYIMGATGDWSDFATQAGPMTESMLVTAQLAYAYPKLAELADLRGDRTFADQLRPRAAELRETMRGQWTAGGWYARGYFGDKQVGKGLPYGEPQPWALLAGVPSDDQARTLVANIRRFLTGIGAPDGPSKIGSAMAPARDDPDITERDPAIDPTDGGLPDVVGAVLGQIPGAPLNGAAAYPGGVWFDVNGWLTWALGEQDGVVPNARELAWDEYTRNTLATHATAFPDHWNGTISIDDACSAWYSDQPDKCGIGVPFWAGQITEQPTWMVMDAIRLAGVTPTEAGYDIAPHLPMDRFSLRAGSIGVAGAPGELRGFVTPEQDGPVVFRVRVPDGAQNVAGFVDGQPVTPQVAGGWVSLQAATRGGQATDWALTWT